MRKPKIVAPLAALMLLTGGVALAQAPGARGDDLLLEMNQAFKRGDKKRLSALLPGARGHTLEPWAAYWELKARLDDASAAEVQDFLARYAGTYQEDRLRADWLLLLGQRRDWAAFAAEYPKYRMRDDREIRCYAIAIDEIARGSEGNANADEVRRNWLSQREADDGCALAADRLYGARKLVAADLWQKVRQSAEANRPRAARLAAQIAAPQVLPALQTAFATPGKIIAAADATPSHAQKEVVLVALARLAASDTALAAHHLGSRLGPYLTTEQRNWAWGAIGRQAALKLDAEAVGYFGQVSRLSDLSDDQLGWMVRALLRSSGQLSPAAWRRIDAAIDAMDPETQREPIWTYWRARALLAQRGEAQGAQARQLLEGIASGKGFYEQLALEELGQGVGVPPRPQPLTPEERAQATRNPGLARALYAIRIGLRPEGVREWNYSTNLVDSQGRPGGMPDRELLAAAQLACEREVWDRCINTSERTKGEIDVEQRYPMPLKDAVQRRTRQIGLDPAYVYGLIRQESRFIMDARSHVGASGLMQVMPATARWTAKKLGMDGFTADQITDRDTNIAIGTGYLKLVLDDFGGSMPLAAAAYNAGPNRPRAWRAPGGSGPVLEAAIWAENIPFNETRDYVKKVLANTTQYAALISGQPQSLKARLGQVGPRTGGSDNRELP